jgi:hypothetical protein
VLIQSMAVIVALGIDVPGAQNRLSDLTAFAQQRGESVTRQVNAVG